MESVPRYRAAVATARAPRWRSKSLIATLCAASLAGAILDASRQIQFVTNARKPCLCSKDGMRDSSPTLHTSTRNAREPPSRRDRNSAAATQAFRIGSDPHSECDHHSGIVAGFEAAVIIFRDETV